MPKHLTLIESTYELGRPSGNLPTEEQFDPYGGDLDAQCAWRNFGGLDLQKAFERFCDNPGCYQEDFMFMGGSAFEFYLPVLVKYLKEIVPEDETDDCEAWILGCALEIQLDEGKTSFSNITEERIRQSCRVVRKRFGDFHLPEENKQRILEQWAKVEALCSDR